MTYSVHFKTLELYGQNWRLFFCAPWGSNISCPRHPTKLVLSWRVFPAPMLDDHRFWWIFPSSEDVGHPVLARRLGSCFPAVQSVADVRCAISCSIDLSDGKLNLPQRPRDPHSPRHHDPRWQMNCCKIIAGYGSSHWLNLGFNGQYEYIHSIGGSSNIFDPYPDMLQWSNDKNSSSFGGVRLWSKP